MAGRRTAVSKKRSGRSKGRKPVSRKGNCPKFRGRRARKMRMSALNSNPFMIEGVVHLRSPMDLHRLSGPGVRDRYGSENN